MHLYVIGKGHTAHLKKWQDDLNAQFIPLMKNGEQIIEDGKKMFVQIAVRPVQLFEIGFPKEHLDAIMSVVGTNDYIINRYKIIGRTLKFLRKLLGLKEVPPPKFINELMQPEQSQKAVAIIPLGIKEDIIDKNGFEQL